MPVLSKPASGPLPAERSEMRSCPRILLYLALRAREMVTERHKLTGWEQIANYLGVSVRTAQVHEREQKLPVHRFPGPKGRVWAFADELDSWNINADLRTSEPREMRGCWGFTPICRGCFRPTSISLPLRVLRRRPA